MFVARISQHALLWGMYLPEGVYLPGGVPAGGGINAQVLPPREQNDRQVQKYYLAQTSFAGGNKNCNVVSTLI